MTQEFLYIGVMGWKIGYRAHAWKVAAGLFLIFSFVDTIKAARQGLGAFKNGDLHIYLVAGQNYRTGLNPFGPLPNTHLHFLYPPFTLPVFGLLSSLDWQVVAFLFVAVKLIVIGVCSIQLTFRRERPWLDRFIVFFWLLTAFLGAGLDDIAMGNITLFETGFLALAIGALRRSQYAIFYLAILVASLCKPLWIVLALVGIFSSRNIRVRLVGIATCLGLFLLHLGSYTLSKQLYQDYLAGIGLVHEHGKYNPSLLEFAKEYFPAGAYAIWSAIGVGQLGLLLTNPKAKSVVSLFSGLVLLLPSVLPRFKDYSFAHLALAACWVPLTSRTQLLLVSLAFVLFTDLHRFLGLESLPDYFNLAASFAFFAWWIWSPEPQVTLATEADAKTELLTR